MSDTAYPATNLAISEMDANTARSELVLAEAAAACEAMAAATVFAEVLAAAGCSAGSNSSNEGKANTQ
jgi:hypothetical protein